MKYLEELNSAQRDAVQNTDGPMMVIAGAGSGKTRVLTYRIAHLINLKVDPFNILALTFTNKAAKEMKARIGRIVGDSEARNIWMGTFHSIFARILRIESDKLNYPSNFTIYDTQDSKSLLKSIIKEMKLDEKVYKPGVVYGRISSAKNNLISYKAYADNSELINEDKISGRPHISVIYQAYVMRCFRSGAMDFDDLLFNTNVLLRDYPDTLLKYQHKFRYVLVDEYQDTNFAQYLIVKKLAAVHENVCVVGDDAQSIYSFRGANIQNILNFKKDYPDFRMFKLEQNYRSTQVIVKAANSIISKNKDQIQKSVWTENPDGLKIKVHCSMTDNDEGYFVAQQIFDIKNNSQAHNEDFAILYRTNAQSRSFEEALRKLNLPYKIYGGLSFYQRKEIKDLLAYYRLTANPNDEEALKRVINYPARGIGKTTLEKLVVTASEHEVSLWEVINEPGRYPAGFNKGTQAKLDNFAIKIKSFATQLNTESAYDLGQSIAYESGIMHELHADKSPEGVSRYDNLQELLAGMKEFSEQEDPQDPDKVNTLSDFLIDVALLTDADKDDGDDDKITLMTIHGAKGLEFPYVNIVGLEENLFPSQMALNSRSELEEERRLFYVALTRAEKQATLSYALTRFKWGDLIQCEPSRFIEDIEEQFLEMPEQKATKRSNSGFNFEQERKNFMRSGGSSSKSSSAFKKKTNLKKITSTPGNDPDFSASDVSELQVGMQVKHQRFGKGKVLKIEGEPPNKKATVFFPATGQKQLLLKFAKLQILN